jgi:hypothetical protein
MDYQIFKMLMLMLMLHWLPNSQKVYVNVTLGLLVSKNVYVDVTLIASFSNCLCKCYTWIAKFSNCLR